MKRVALVVGINRYPDLLDNQDKAQHLTTAATEADQLANRLRDSGGFEVYRLPQVEGEQRINPQGQVSKKELGEAIFRLFLPETGEVPETALLYFAGHGWQDVVEGQSQGYLMTSDSCPEVGDRGLPLQWLRKVLEKSQVRQQLVWLDCCHSGALFNFADQDLLTFFEKEQDRCFMAASREFEPSVSGVFTPKLLDGLDPSNQPDGVVSNVSLGAFLAEAMKDAPHHPMIRNPGGEILLTTQQGVRDHVCPYKGLAYFDFRGDDPQYFFGRTALTNELVRRVEVGSFLAVLGMSGSGKSSVVRAGLLHRLAAQGRRWTIYAPFTPGDHPLNSLRQAVGVELEQLEGVMRAAATERAIVVIDQFEEVFTLCRDEGERQGFLVGLLGAVERLAGKLCLVVVMRADFFGKCAERAYGGLAKTMEQHLVTVLPMEEGELREAIVYPAERVGVEIDRELVTQMIGDVAGSPGSLPLMQYALTQLWKLKTLNRLRLVDYTRLGGVTKALGNHADGVYGALSPEEQGVARRIFLELTQLGEGTEDTRRQVEKGMFLRWSLRKKLVYGVLDQLVGARLVVVSQREQGDSDRKVDVVDIAHEALIRYWLRLRVWINENRATLQKARRLEEAAQEWRRRGGKQAAEDFLLQGFRLGEAVEFVGEGGEMVTMEIRMFVEASLRRARRQKYVRWGLGTTAVTVLLAFSGFSWLQMRDAQRQLIYAQALTSARLTTTPHGPEGLVRGIYALDLSLGHRNQWQLQSAAQSGLLTALIHSRERNQWQGHKSRVNSVAWSPDGQRILTGGEDGTVRLWDRDGNAIGEPWQVDENGVRAVSWSPDGQRVVTDSTSNWVQLWDKDGNAIGEPWQGHTGPVKLVAWSPDGQQILTGDIYGTVRLWDSEGNIIGEPWRVDENGVDSVAWSPDGQQVVTGGINGTVRLWDKEGNAIGEPWQGHEADVISVAWSPDGQWVVTGATDGILRLWDRDGNAIGEPWQGHGWAVSSVAWSPNGRWVVSGSEDSTVRLWDREGNTIGEPWKTGHGAVNSIAWSSDGQRIVTGGDDGIVRLWDGEGNAIGGTWRGHENSVNSAMWTPEYIMQRWGGDSNTIGERWRGRENLVLSVAWSPDGQRVVTGDGYGIVRLWDREGNVIGEWENLVKRVYVVAWSPDGQRIVSGNDTMVQLWDGEGNTIGEAWQSGHSMVSSLAWSPDGQYIVTGGDDGTVQLWDREGNAIGESWSGHESRVNAVAWSPDGQRIVTGGSDGIVRLWDRKGNAIGEPWRGHENSVNAVVWSPDGQRVVTGGDDDTVRLWDRKGNAIGEPWQSHEGGMKSVGELWYGDDRGVNSVAWSPDGQRIVAGTDNGTVQMWDRDGNIIGKEWGHTNGVSSVAWSPDGQRIVTGGSDGVRLWHGSWPGLLTVACNRLQFHPIFQNPADFGDANFVEIAQSAKAACERRVWSQTKA